MQVDVTTVTSCEIPSLEYSISRTSRACREKIEIWERVGRKEKGGSTLTF